MPGVSQAQEATVIGTVTDDSGGVMPGVVVTAIHEASGNRFEAITESGGGFRLPVRVGTYRVTATLEGFATLTRTGIEMLVGQQATIDLRLVPASLQENVTVSASGAAARAHQLAPSPATSIRGRWPTCRSTAATSST